jgi:acetylglutamate kinase
MTQKPSKELKELKDFRTTKREEFGYIMMVCKELAKMLWDSLTSSRKPARVLPGNDNPSKS